jgi:hypothetical protein
MKLLEGKSKSEQYKLIAAVVLGVLAIFSIAFFFFGDSFSSSNKSANGNANKNKGNKSSSPSTQRAAQTQTGPEEADTFNYGPIDYNQTAPPSVVAGRNIFDIYVLPQKPTPTPYIAPTPPPIQYPLTLSSVSPGNVYARTPDDFTLQVTGDKFTPDSCISFDNNDLPTRFISPQQLSATVPASFIANEGARQILVRTPDGKLFSNTGTLNVTAPPAPPYHYVGLIGDKYYNKDIALLRDKNNEKILVDVKRGQEVGNTFRVVSISEAEIVLIDKNLKIKHTLPFLVDKNASSRPGFGNNPSSLQPGNRNFPQTEIPGIPGNIPRFQQPKKADDDDDDDPNR